MCFNGKVPCRLIPFCLPISSKVNMLINSVYSNQLKIKNLYVFATT